MDNTDDMELRAFFGLLLLRGMLCHNHWDVENIWTDLIGHPLFSCTMSRNRFKFLLRFIYFDDKDTRQERKRRDKFSAMREIFELWNDQCAKLLIPSDYVTIDECLYASRNHVGFRTFNPNKPARYGINIKCLNDASFPFCYRSEVYAGI